MTFVKGQSGNPKGRAVGGDKPATDALRMEVSADEHKTLRDLAKILISRAKAGDMQAMNTIFDRLDGKPVQQNENHNINENHYVRAPEKAAPDDWQNYLAHKAKPPQPVKPNGSRNGKSH